MQKLQDQQTQAGRNTELHSPGRREKLSPAERASPCGRIQTAAAILQVPPTLTHHARATPVPTFTGGGREAGSQSDDDGERGCQIPLCPCHGPAGPPGTGQGHLGCPSTSASERPELRHTPANAKALCAHCSHPHRRAARQGGSSLPVTARKPMGWVGSAASPPSRTTRARCTQPVHPDGGLPLPAAVRPPSLVMLEQPPLFLALPIPLRCSRPAAARAKLAA